MKNLSKKQTQALYTIVGIIIVAIICAIFLQFYNSSNDKKMLEASTIYQKALIANENPKSSVETKIAKFEQVVNDYPNTSFGIFASWQLADLYTTPTKLDSKNFNVNITNLPKAIDILQQSIENNPKDSLSDISKVRLARLYIVAKQPDQAIKTLQDIKSFKDNAYPLMLLGQAYSEKKDKVKAIESWQKALQDPNSSDQFKQIISQLINNTN
ncbi:tetratricopeptide repeat protein [Francisella tularensis subsp. novicida]|uniref:YfgM family protein n=1 Tax=Francisella tularensis TaxID=263 RepID=UPI00050353F5|nr:tetratricopeptide repeat protein [Francisella tularensis]AJJ47565.1 tetratricopeptide repeat family protein [Francisella tularensis subsp. novicida]KFJ67774.1 tetratricopeptide repeat family protein [Francisella tularensis subsp. novicida]MBK2343783.1 tetratricopeptide repeat protein [Francisella tularensis subsp. novicida]MBK2349126.1 tetratricopeptide repeat protein [Francisella tularensis subsp. novicida]MBK2352638.1 tetratricopeptide repeat protein [Francisella tularensis subsp. novicid